VDKLLRILGKTKEEFPVCLELVNGVYSFMDLVVKALKIKILKT